MLDFGMQYDTIYLNSKLMLRTDKAYRNLWKSHVLSRHTRHSVHADYAKKHVRCIYLISTTNITLKITLCLMLTCSNNLSTICYMSNEHRHGILFLLSYLYEYQQKTRVNFNHVIILLSTPHPIQLSERIIVIDRMGKGKGNNSI